MYVFQNVGVVWCTFLTISHSFVYAYTPSDPAVQTLTRTFYTCPCDDTSTTYIPGLGGMWSQWESMTSASLPSTTYTSVTAVTTHPQGSLTAKPGNASVSTTTTSGPTSQTLASGTPFSVDVQVSGNLTKRSTYALGLTGSQFVLVEEVASAVGFVLGAENALTLLGEGFFIGVGSTEGVQTLTTFESADAAAVFISLVDGILTMAGATFISDAAGVMAVSFGAVPSSYYSAVLTPNTASDSYNPSLTGGNATTASTSPHTATSYHNTTPHQTTTSLSDPTRTNSPKTTLSSFGNSTTTPTFPATLSDTVAQTATLASETFPGAPIGATGTPTSLVGNATITSNPVPSTSEQPNCVTITEGESSMLSCKTYPATSTIKTTTSTTPCTPLATAAEGSCSSNSFIKIDSACFSQVCGNFPLGNPYKTLSMSYSAAISVSLCTMNCALDAGCAASWWTETAVGPSAALTCNLYAGVAGAQDTSSGWWTLKQACPANAC